MGATAAEECRRRGRPRKSRRHRARPSPPPPRRRSRRVYYSDEDDDGGELGHEEEEIEDDDDSDGDDDDSDEGHRVKKKLKLLVKLHRPPAPPPPPPPPPSSGDDDEDVEEEDGEYLCYRGGSRGGDRKAERRRVMDCDYRGGSAYDSGTPLPDRNMSESILEKIQKKDKYNVFAEPVDLDELPDYLVVIEHPMDFTTIRKKLARSVYSNLEELEADVFLVCTNAMQYNAPETIYHKQARSMQEVARKCFQSVRAECRASENIPKLELNDLANSPEKDPPKSSSKTLQEGSSKTVQEAAVFDTSLVAVATTNGNNESELKAEEAIGSEKFIKDSGSAVTDVSFTTTGSMPDKAEKVEKVEKVEELSEKTTPSKSGQKLVAGDENHHPVDENRRATYNISTQSIVTRPDSIFSTFEAEKKQLVAVGLDEEYSYARSLARFAATLGPIAWKIASEEIKKALPDGIKFGPGWVGEYEPLSMHFISVEESIPHTRGHIKVDRYTTESREKQNGELEVQYEAENIWHTQGHNKLDRYVTESKEDKQNGELKAQHEAENIWCTQGHNKVDRYITESKEDKRHGEVKTHHIASSTSVQVSMPCLMASQSAGGLETMPTPNAKKSKHERNAEEKLGPFQFSSRQQPEIKHDLVCQQGDKLAGVPWKDRTIDNGKANVPKKTPSQNSFSACSDISDSALRMPQFQLGATGPGFLPSLGYRIEAKPDSTEGMLISKNQTPTSMNAGFSMKMDAANIGRAPISINAESSEKNDAANSCNRGRSLSGSMSSSAAAINNSHANNGAVQVTIDSVKLRTVMPGIMPKLRNFPNSMFNSTRQFIPAPSLVNHSAGSGIVSGNCGVTRSECTSAGTPINSWISIGNCTECKPTEAPSFLKVQPEPNIYRPTSITSLASGMYRGKQLLPPSSPNVTNGRPLFSLSHQMLAEKSDPPNNNPPSFPLTFTSEMSRPQQMFPWRGPALHGQQRQSDDMLPPDLNIGFQSPGSPVQRSSGIHVDSQPDLALQL